MTHFSQTSSFSFMLLCKPHNADEEKRHRALSETCHRMHVKAGTLVLCPSTGEAEAQVAFLVNSGQVRDSVSISN